MLWAPSQCRIVKRPEEAYNEPLRAFDPGKPTIPCVSQTRVPISKTKTDIEELPVMHRAFGFVYVSVGNRAFVAFNMAGRRVLVMPFIYDCVRRPRNARRTAVAQQSRWQQAWRQRLRTLLFVIKTKLEATESGIATLESEALANLVLTRGGTVGQRLEPQVGRGVRDGTVAADARTRIFSAE